MAPTIDGRKADQLVRATRTADVSKNRLSHQWRWMARVGRQLSCTNTQCPRQLSHGGRL